ncbi:hypothetical protein GCM10027610_065780 [Dactylosporangium cerinum]
MAVHSSRGRRPTRSATRCQPEVLTRTASPKRGTNGQKTHRPSSTSSAGSSVVITARDTMMPLAAIGPKPRMSFICAASRHSTPIVTVAAEARIAGNDLRTATAIAAVRSSWRCSSSR